MRLLAGSLLFLAFIPCLLADETTPLTTPAAAETASEEAVTEAEEETATEAEEEAVTEQEQTATEAPEDVSETSTDAVTTSPAEDTTAGEVVIEADNDESDTEEEETVVKTAAYTMTTDASLGLTVEITLEYLSSGRVRLVCEMEEQEVSTESAEEETTAAADTTVAPAEEEEAAVTEATRGLSESFLPATIYIIDDATACSDLAAAVANGLTVDALPLAAITAVGNEVGYLDVSWDDIKKGECLAILKESTEAATEAEAEAVTEAATETATEAATEAETEVPRRRRRKRENNILRTEGLARTFGAITLSSFTVLSIGVTGAFAVAAVYVAAAAAPSVVTSGNAVNFWQLNAPLIYAIGGILGLFALSYYFSRRDEIQQRVSTNLSQWSQRLNRLRSSNRAQLAGRMDAFEDGMVDLAERVIRGIPQWSPSFATTSVQRIARAGSAMVEPYMKYYKAWLPSTKFYTPIHRLDKWLKDISRSDPGVYQGSEVPEDQYW